METIIDYLKRKLREAGSPRWAAIAEAASDGLAPDDRVSVHLLRKIAYGDRDNPGVQTVQPLLDFFSAVELGVRELPPLPEPTADIAKVA